MLAFNWTKVELKHDQWQEVLKIWNSFNWTKVELKQSEEYYGKMVGDPFNWTKVELKRKFCNFLYIT